MAKKLLSYVVIGFKLFLLLMLASFIMLIPNLVIRFLFGVTPVFALILSIPLIVVGLGVEGWLVYKYRRWLLR